LTGGDSLFFLIFAASCRRSDYLVSWAKTPGQKYALFLADFPFWIYRQIPENPAKPPFPVLVENAPFYRSVCQNTAGMHLVKCMPEAIEPRLFLPLSLPHPDAGKAAGMRIRGSFFPGGGKKRIYYPVFVFYGGEI